MKKFLLVFSAAFCFLTPAFAQTPTWSEDVAPILYANCTKCHHPGGAGHFSLLTFADAYTWAFSMESQTGSRNMPPWPPDENYKHYARERVLSQTDIDKISQWVAGGRLQGDITLAPTQPTYTNASALGTVDLSVRIPAYIITSNTDVYRNFPITTTIPAGKYITGIEVIPGNSHIVHHVLVFEDSTNQPAQLDAAQAGPGYDNAGGTGSLASKLIAGYTPGASPYYTPVGTGFRLAANTNIVVQVHYPAGSQGLLDSTRVNFKLTSIPQREITVWPILNHLQNINSSINIPANQTRTYTETQLVNTNYTVLAAFPHMHLIGRTIKSWANQPVTNDTIRFLNVPDWDFHWQDTYVFPNAVRVPSGSTYRAVATYDNTTNNPDNPSNPPQTVVAGEATTNEMMMVFFSYMPYVSGDENLIIDRRIIAQGATTFCNGQSVELKMIEGTGYTYQWYRDGVLINNANTFSYTATQAGNYSALISLGPNSSLTDTVAIAIASTPAAAITPATGTAFCPGGSVTLNASAGSGYSYQWFNNGTPIANATSPSYNASATGSYTVQVYNGCYATSTAVNVTAASVPSATVTPSGATTFCQGGNVTLSAPQGLTYNWSTNATTQTINVTQTGNYTVTVTNGSNCSAVSSVTSVTVNSLPSAAVTPTGATTFCAGGSVTLSAPAGLNYTWSTTATSRSILVTQTGSYLVTVTNANNCSAVSSPVNVVVNSLPSAVITPGGATSFCQGGSVLLSANTSSSYHWNDNSSSQTLTATASGTYSVTVTNANNCSNTASISVTEFATPDATVTSNIPTTICPGDSVTLSAPAGMTYNWSNGASAQSIVAYADDVFYVTVTDNNSCTAVSLPTTVTVSNNAVAGITASGATTFCEDSSVQLTATTGSAYLWSNGATTQSIAPATAGSYTVTVTASGNCIGISNPVTVVVHPNPAVPAITTSNSNEFCEGESTDLSAPTGYAYLWSNGSTAQTIQVTQTGAYALTITDANTCSAVANSVAVTVHSLPTVVYSGNTDTLCSDADAVTLIGGSPAGGTYSGNGVSANSFVPASAGAGVHTITYSFTDGNGCSNTASKTIEVVTCTGINEADKVVLQIKPNPSNGNFEISWSGMNEEVTLLQIYDVAGKLIQHIPVMQTTATRVDISTAADGCYFARLTGSNRVVYRKLIVQK